MIVTRKALPRRMFLRAVGTPLILPLLDPRSPPRPALADTPADPARLRGLGFVFMPMGSDTTRWTPPGAQRLDRLSPSLSSLEPVKDHVTVISNLELLNAYPGTHSSSNSAFLSAAKPKHTASTDYFLATTPDQPTPKQTPTSTPLPS